MQKKTCEKIKDCKVMVGESIVKQHYMIVEQDKGTYSS